MATNNGTKSEAKPEPTEAEVQKWTEEQTRIGAALLEKAEAEAKAKAEKGKPKSKFQEAFNFLRDVEGGKPKTTLTRKTEEGKMSASLAGIPKSLTTKAVQELAAEVGLKAQVKSDAGVGAAEASSTRSLTEENAEKFVKIITAE